MARAYVYAITVDGVVRYIGKGTGRRSADHLKVCRSIARRRAAGLVVQASAFYKRLTRAWLDGSEIGETVLLEGLTDDQAFAAEAAAIQGAPGGQLWNEEAGGRGRTSAGMKRQWQDADYAARMREVLRTALSEPDRMSRMLEASKAAMQAPEERARKSAATKLMRAERSADQEREVTRKAVASREAEWRTGVTARVLAYITNNEGCSRRDVHDAFAEERAQTRHVAISSLKRRGYIEDIGGSLSRTDKQLYLH